MQNPSSSASTRLKMHWAQQKKEFTFLKPIDNQKNKIIDVKDIAKKNPKILTKKKVKLNFKK